MKAPIAEGSAVISKKGRDKGRWFVVLYMVDSDFAMIADGDTRKLDHLKRKRLKHLTSAPAAFPELVSLYARKRLLDADIRKALMPWKRPISPDEMKEGSSVVEK